MRREKLTLVIAMILGLVAFTSCQDNNRQNEAEVEDREEMVSPTGDQDRVDRDDESLSSRIQGDEEISTYSMGMTRAELTDDFAEGEGPFTVFAPENAAYEKLSKEERERIEASVKTAGSSTNYLIVERELPMDQLIQSIRDTGGELELITMQGERLVATLQGDEVVLRDGRGNTAKIKRADTGDSDIVVHVIDNVLQPVDIDRNDFVEEHINTEGGANTTTNNQTNNR